MAAHSISILLRMANSLQLEVSDEWRKQYIFALDYAPGMDELSLDRWRVLHNTLRPGHDTGVLYTTVLSILAEQIAEWIDLGGPGCHEDWVKAKYREVSDECDSATTQ